MTATISSNDVDHGVTPPGSLPLRGTAAGACAALVPLVACLVVAVVGWFLADGGVHGSPRDALRTGTLAWLMGHGSGVTVRGVAVTAVPLGLTLLCAASTWRFGLRLGEEVAGHGPDAAALADGERDLTVPMAAGLFSAAYVVVGTLAAVLAGTSGNTPAIGSVIGWSLALAGLVGGAGIATGSGRAAVWVSRAPAAALDAVHAAWTVITTFLLVGLVFFAVALVLDLGAAMSVMSQLHLDLGDGLILCLLMLTVVPNAVVFSGAFLLGPGFTLGTGTLVSPSVVAIGPVPMFPMLAALPANGPTPGWMLALVAVPMLCAAAAVFRFQRRRPVLAWDAGALQGVVAGVVAGLAFGLLGLLSGGAVGPGRMADVGPLAGEAALHGMVAFAIGGLLGGLVATWLARRAATDVDHAAP